MRRASRGLLLAAFGLLMACSEATNGTGMISKRIGEAAQTGSKEIDLGQLTTFGWNRVFVLKPGTTREEVCRRIGAKRNQCGRVVRIERAPDDHLFLIFALDGYMTHIELHALANGRFDFDFPADGLARSDAIFRVRRAPDGAAETLWLARR